MKRGKSSLWIVLAVVAVILVLGGLFLWRRAAASNPVAATPTATVERGTLRVTVSASGAIEPATQVDLTFAQPSGRVAEVLVNLGDPVRAGQPLARLETTDLERAVTQAEINLRSAQVRLERLQQPADEADIRQAQDGVAQAAAALQAARLNLNTVLSSTLLNETLDDAESAFNDARNVLQARTEEYERGETAYWFVDQAQQRYDDALRNLTRIRQQADLQRQNAQNEVDRAQQTYQEARDRLEALLAGADPLDLEAAQLDVEAAQLNLDRARRDLEQATLTAPFDGIVAAVNVTVGETPPAGLPAVSLVDPSHYRITVNVDEIDVARLSVGLPAEVTVDALPDLTFTGVVERIGPTANRDQGAVSYPVVIALDPTTAPLRGGMSSTVVIMVEELTDQLLIPNWVVRVDQTTGQTFVYRRTAEGMERVDVRLGVRYEGYSQVLSGLQEGDVLLLVRDQTNGFGFGQQ